MKILIISLLILLTGPFAFATSPDVLEADTTKAIELIYRTSFPEQHFNNVELSDLCAYLTDLTKRQDPENRGIKFILNKELQKEKSQEASHTLTFNTTNLLYSLNKICYVLSLSYSIEGDTVTFRKK
jgi:hypothetical protein